MFFIMTTSHINTHENSSHFTRRWHFFWDDELFLPVSNLHSIYANIPHLVLRLSALHSRTHCSPFHHWPYTTTEYPRTHVYMLFFLYVSEIWPFFFQNHPVYWAKFREIWDYYTYLRTNLQRGVWWKSWNLRLLHLFMHKSSTWSLMEIISESVRVESGIAKKHPVFNF